MIQSTADRLCPLIPAERTWILTGQSMVVRATKSLPGVPEEQILAEPAARNTAPCIGWAAAKLLHADPEATMVVLPADHVIKPESAFCDTIQFAAELVEEAPERLVTLGIKPTFASTSYGYIQRSDALQSAVAEQWKALTTPYDVLRFHEKPAAAKAEDFLRSGGFAWNAGIFVWKAQTVYDLLRRFEPEIGARLEQIAAVIGTEDEQAATDAIFPGMKKISIDYAVMEKAESIVMLEAPFSWDDVGTWCALDRLYSANKDGQGNLAVGVKILAIDSENCIVRGDDPNHLFALLGMKDVIVVQTEDATLLAAKEREEAVRDVIEMLKKKGWNEFL